MHRAIRGFIDHDIAFVVGVDHGGHFDTVVGYWDQGTDFHVYTADPIDGLVFDELALPDPQELRVGEASVALARADHNWELVCP